HHFSSTSPIIWMHFGRATFLVQWYITGYLLHFLLNIALRLISPALNRLNTPPLLFRMFSNIGAPLIATASTRQYQAETPLGGLPCDNWNIGSSVAHRQVPTAVPINSSHVVIKKAAR